VIWRGRDIVRGPVVFLCEAHLRYDWNLATIMKSCDWLLRPKLSDMRNQQSLPAARGRSCLSPLFIALFIGSVFAANAPKKAPAPDPAATARRGTDLAEAGQCGQALPLLTKSVSHLADKDLKKRVGFYGLRCAMAMNQTDPALDFIRMLTHEFPNDPEVLYLATHVFSDLSIRASQALLYTAPGSYQVHELNAEALETQGNWKDAAVEYHEVLKKNSNLVGIHYRLGRLLLSAPKTATSREEAGREFEEELKIDPTNAGAEYILGELAREDEQWPAAIQHFGRAAKLDAGFADAFIGLGRSLIAGGRAAEAISPLETAEKLQPDNPVPHFHLATAYRRSGRKQDADREFNLHQQTSEKARQSQQNIQAGVTGPQEVLGPQKAEP
jgi:tetratricopeptide (TPR) repeat protein